MYRDMEYDNVMLISCYRTEKINASAFLRCIFTVQRSLYVLFFLVILFPPIIRRDSV